MTLTIGWWAIPTAITCLAFLWACSGNDEYGIGAFVGVLIKTLIALIVSLIAWLGYFAGLYAAT